jgi:hypothetical protein
LTLISLFALSLLILLAGCSPSAVEPVTVTVTSNQPPVTIPITIPAVTLTEPAPPASTVTVTTTRLPVVTETVTYTPTTTQPAIPWQIAGVTYKIVERNDIWWKFSWSMLIRNNTQSSIMLDGRIKYLDQTGFVLDDDLVTDLYLTAGSEKDFSDYSLLSPGVGIAVHSIQADLHTSY